MPDARCVSCYQTSGNISVVPTELQQHLHTKHVDSKDRHHIFKHKRDELKHSETCLTSVFKWKCVVASHKISYHFSHCGEACVIAEYFIILYIENSFVCAC